jgi:GNAT superfamily N-acetyltransferase
MTMTLDYEIASARLQDIPFLPSIEKAAATLLKGYEPDSVLEATTTEAEFEDTQKGGRLWVARTNCVPAGFAHADIQEPTVACLKELDVHPEHARRGVGRTLVMAVCAWAIAKHRIQHGRPGSTLCRPR